MAKKIASQPSDEGPVALPNRQNLCYSAFKFLWHMLRIKRPYKFEELGTVPGDGEQAWPSGSEKPKVSKWSPTLKNMGLSFC